MTDLEEKGKRLAKAVLKWSRMPPSGNKRYVSDFVYAAEVVVPLADKYLVTSKQEERKARSDA